MVDRFPLLDGTEIDINDRFVDVERDETKAITLRADFAEEMLPWWLSYQTDSGPASPTINGLATSGGETMVELETGSGATGNTTALVGPTINWHNWREIRVFVWGASVTANAAGSRFAVSLADNDTILDASEQIRLDTYQDEAIGGKIKTGGAEQNNFSTPLAPPTDDDLGFRIYETEVSDGHSVDFVFNGQFRESWSEANGFPTESDLTLYFMLRTDDGNQTVAEFDGILIELVPY